MRQLCASYQHGSKETTNTNADESTAGSTQDAATVQAHASFIVAFECLHNNYRVALNVVARAVGTAPEGHGDGLEGKVPLQLRGLPLQHADRGVEILHAHFD